LREQTLLDPEVRHAGEISADRVSLHWQPGAFVALKREVARALGVPQLDAWLHNLLVYGPGQFFKPHQDTEKHDGMVATLVVVWPSPHIGGTLRVQFGSQSAELASQHLQAPSLRWFAFYADCRHEVLPVLEGWRVVLTFDLVLPAQLDRPRVPDGLRSALETTLRQQFVLDNGEPNLAPWVLLLDHEYTEHGLRWPLLKGEDRRRAEALRAAAESLGLRLHLALAELHQTWSAQPARRSRWARDDDVGEGDAEPGELIDESLMLDFWVDEHDLVGPRSSMPVELKHTATFTETGPAHLVNQEYEGYMGNYGETLDYWYRRAALVVQSPLAAERDRFQLDFDGALADARRLAQTGEANDTLVRRVRAASSLLARAAVERGRSVLSDYADVAAALPDAELALTLMKAFDYSALLPHDAAVLGRLAEQRGTTWARALLGAWHERQLERVRRGATWSGQPAVPALWPTPLPDFTQAAMDAGWASALLGQALAACVATLRCLDDLRAKATPAQQLQQRPGGLLAASELALALRMHAQGSAAALHALIEHLLSRPALYPLADLAPVVRAAGAASDHCPAGHALRAQVLAALRAALAAPQRSPTDHHLQHVEWTCRCRDCTGMIDWAESPDPQPWVQPMAEQRRHHVQAQVTAAGAPLSAAVLKQGSPYKLVLRKPEDLHARDSAQRQRWADDLKAMLA